MSHAPEGAAAIAALAPLFEMRGIGKRFGTLDALAGVDIAFRPGEIHCLLGETGAAKSTPCSQIFGIHTPTPGERRLDGAPHAPSGPRAALGRGVAMAPQHFSLAEDLSVMDNLLLGGALGRIDRAEEGARLTALAQSLGLDLDMLRRVGELSIGQRQRVEIVRCLMRAEPPDFGRADGGLAAR
jgi:simple sugar transport system ATP-binding protein